MIKRLAPLFSLCVALACGSPTGVQESFTFGEPFWLPLEQAVVSEDATTFVRFSRVIENSICPVNAVCIWAGRIILELGVTVPPFGEELVQFESSHVPDDLVRVVHGRRIEWLGFRPPNRVGAPPVRPDIQLEVTSLR